MASLNIICIDDQRVILMALQKDLSDFKPLMSIWDCESASEAREVMEARVEKGESIALVICDHVMPETNGIEFLYEINKDERFQHTKTILLTGMATYQDTRHAVNQPNIDRYVEKPWEGDALRIIVSELITVYIVQKDVDYEPFMPILHQVTLRELLKTR